MTLDDLIAFLRDETERQTLTEQAITRTILLAFELGVEAGKGQAYTLLADVRTLLTKEEQRDAP